MKGLLKIIAASVLICMLASCRLPPRPPAPPAPPHHGR
ncbi:hypothetical protein M2347_003654 [Chryseobacterium sp. H1D6B]|nr:hypothetical protein [Chryseobacterium sp. H1D6B]